MSDRHALSCPHCGSQDARMCADHLGSVGWCTCCNRAWIPPQPKRLLHIEAERPRARLRAVG